MTTTRTPSATRTWITRSVVGIVLATFFSDVGHEMVTAVLPQYLGSLALGAAALGVVEGIADLVFSLSKLGGGVAGHHVRRKRPLTALGYLVTAVATGAMALVHSAAALVSLRAAAWIGRGFRSPLRDFLLSDEVGPTHFGRAYGVERAADMLGAVIGPLVAAALVWAGVPLRTVILVSIVPSMVSVAAIWLMTRDRDAPAAASPPPAAGEPAAGEPVPGEPAAGEPVSGEPMPATGSRPGGPSPAAPRARLPRRFWLFLVGVTLFGLGDFSRTFLILLAAIALGEVGPGAAGDAGMLSVAVLLYAGHNAVSALAAYPAGRIGDATSRLAVLCAGYGLGVITNCLLAVFAATDGPLILLVAVFVLSGVYLAVEETIEKATAAQMLPRELRSLGLGVLASANAIGDMAASLYVGLMLAAGHAGLAFAVPAALGLVGTLWTLWLSRAGEP